MSFLLWIGIVISIYYVVQKPGLFSAFTGLVDTLWTLLVALLLFFNAYAIGTRVLSWSGSSAIDAIDRLLLGCGLGLGILGLLGLAFSAAQLANDILLSAFQIGIAIFFVFKNYAGKLKEDMKAFLANLNLAFSQYGSFTKVAIILPILFSFLLTLVPPFEAFDALSYHLVQPAQILHDGGLRAADIVPFWYPNLAENLYLWALALQSERAPQILHFLWALLSVGLLWRWAVKIWNPEIGRKTLLLLATIASLPILSSWAYVDMALVYYAVASLYAYTLSETTQNPSWLLVTGIMAGLAMGVKYTSFTVPLTCGLLILFRYRFDRAFLSAARFSILAIAVALPWYVRNAIFMGNPFYPFVFGGRYWDPFRAEWYTDSGTGIGWNLLQIFLVPLNMVLGHREITPMDGRVGPVFLILLPLTLWVSVSGVRRNPAQTWSLRSIHLFSALSFAAWTLGVINSAHLWQIRLFLPALLPFAIPTALGWNHLGKLDTQNLRISFLFNVLISIVIGLTIFANGLFILQRNPLAVAFGAQTREGYIARVNPSYAALLQSMEDLPAEAYVYSLFEPRSYGLPRQTQPDVSLYNFAHDWHLYRTPPEILRQWKARGYTHVIVYERGLNFMMESPSSKFILAMQTALADTVSRLNLLLQTPDKVYTIYRIP